MSGLENKHASGPTHAITPGTWLSSVSPRISHDPFGATTADQVAAQHIGQDTPLPSLEVSTEEPIGGGACDRNYGCSYGATISFRNADDAAADGVQSAQAVPAPVRSGRHARGAQGARGAVCERARRRRGQGRGAAEARRAVGPRDARRLSRERARDRAPRAEDGGERPVAHPAAGRSGRHSEQVRRPDEPDVRHGRARVASESHAHHDVHDGGRGQQHDLQPDRRAGRVPRAVAPSEQRAEAPALAESADLQHEDLRALRAEAQPTRRTATARCSITRSFSTAAT